MNNHGASISCYEIRDSAWDRWDDFVDRSATGAPYAISSYISLLAELLNHHPRIFVAEHQGQWVCGIALLEAKGRLGVSVINRLLMHYNGFIIGKITQSKPVPQSTQLNTESKPGPEFAPDLVQSAISRLLELLEKRRYLSCSLHSRPPLATVLQPQTDCYNTNWQCHNSSTYEVDLEAYSFNNLSKNTRRLFRRAQEHGLIFEQSTDLDACYVLHRETLTRKGATPYLSAPLLQRYLERILALKLGSLTFATTADGERAAMQFNLHSRNPMSHTVLAGSSPDWNRLGANVFLRLSNFDHLRNLGYQGNDLTGAASPGVARFKLEVGGIERQTWIHRQPRTLRGRIIDWIRTLRTDS